MPTATDLTAALAERVVVLDGGLATELERAGHDLSGELWSAELLRRDPAAIVAAHQAYLSAGAEVITTASYQASVTGFARAGLDDATARRLIGDSVAVAREAIGDLAGRWVAASVGPYGAVLADGSEYTGSYAAELGVAGLRAFHRPRLELLAEAGPDLLALETLPALAEVEALLLELDDVAVPAWVSLTTVTDPAGVARTRLGEPAAEAFALAAQSSWVIAAGVNCTAPEHVPAALAAAAPLLAAGKPLVVYPNSGESWDAAARSWRPADSASDESPGLGAELPAWQAAGARLVGGCCRVGPAQIARLAQAVRPAGLG